MLLQIHRERCSINSINPVAQIAPRHIISFLFFSQNARDCTRLIEFFFSADHDVKRDGGGGRRHDGDGDHRASSRSCCTCEPRIPRRRAHTSTGTHVYTHTRKHTRAHTGARTFNAHTPRARARARARTENRLHLIPACYILTTRRGRGRGRDARMKRNANKTVEFARAIPLGANLARPRSPSFSRLPLASRFLYISLTLTRTIAFQITRVP